MGVGGAINAAKLWVIRRWVYRKWWHFNGEGFDVTEMLGCSTLMDWGCCTFEAL